MQGDGVLRAEARAFASVVERLGPGDYCAALGGGLLLVLAARGAFAQEGSA